MKAIWQSVYRFVIHHALMLGLCFVSALFIAIFSSVLFAGWEMMDFSQVYPWTIFIYLFSSQVSHQVNIVAWVSLLLTTFFISTVLVTFLPGKYDIYRRKIGGYLLSGFLLFGVINWLISFMAVWLYPTGDTAMPWTALQLLVNYEANEPIENILLVLALVGALVVIIHLIFKRCQCFFAERKPKYTRWATYWDLQRLGLFQSHGLLIGQFNGKLIYTPIKSHILIFAPSRSGKGVAQVIPNALLYDHSMLIIDIKSETFKATSGFRHKYGQQIIKLDFSDEGLRTHHWNFLDAVRRKSIRTVSDLQLIIDVLIPTEADGEENMWISEARSLALGLLLWLMESRHPFTMAELNNIVKGHDLQGFLENILANAVTPDGQLTINETAYINIKNFVQKAEKERSGVKSTLTARLRLWDDELIRAATAFSDFDVRDMRRKKMTIYLCIPPNQLGRLAPLINIFVQQFLTLLTDALPGTDEPYHVLGVLDEFCALSRMEKLREGFGFLAGFNVHLMAVIQNMGQFYGLYGRDRSEVFLQNTDYKIAYRQNTLTDQRFVSDLLGPKHTVAKGKSYKETLGLKDSASQVSENEREEYLLSPSEVGRLEAKKAIALISGSMPILFEKVFFYLHPDLKKRVLPPAEILPIELLERELYTEAILWETQQLAQKKEKEMHTFILQAKKVREDGDKKSEEIEETNLPSHLSNQQKFSDEKKLRLNEEDYLQNLVTEKAKPQKNSGKKARKRIKLPKKMKASFTEVGDEK